MLDANDVCANTPLRIAVDSGSDYWETEQLGPESWSGEVDGEFRWSGDTARFIGPDGVTLVYRRLAPGEFSEMNCYIGE